MDKTKPDQALRGRPVAKRIVAKMKLYWQRKVVNIKNVIVGHAMAEELQKTAGGPLHVECAPDEPVDHLKCRIREWASTTASSHHRQSPLEAAR